MADDRIETYRLERYKYVLSQKQSLNSATIQIITMYQAGLALIVAGQFTVYTAKLDPQIVVIASWAPIILLAILSVFTLLLLASGVLSWLSYRRDEASIELEVYGNSRPMPSVRDIMSWFETYFSLAIIVVFALYAIAFWKFLLPHLPNH